MNTPASFPNYMVNQTPKFDNAKRKRRKKRKGKKK